MNQRLRLNIILSLSSFLFACLALEGLLRLADPLGTFTYHYSNAQLRRHGTPHPARGYLLKPGTYELRQFTVTIQEDYTRRLPDSTSTGCHIAFLGDSVTFGLGVDDAQTWPNLVARQFPTVHFTNLALSGYNARNIVAAHAALPADGYIYLAIPNDNQPPEIWNDSWQTNPLPTGLSAYLLHGLRSKLPGTALSSTYDEDIDTLLAHGDVLTFALEGYSTSGVLLARYPDTVLIPEWSTPISDADAHPDPNGHRELAESMLPFVRAWLPTRCPSHFPALATGAEKPHPQPTPSARPTD